MRCPGPFREGAAGEGPVPGRRGGMEDGSRRSGAPVLAECARWERAAPVPPLRQPARGSPSGECGAPGVVCGWLRLCLSAGMAVRLRVSEESSVRAGIPRLTGKLVSPPYRPSRLVSWSGLWLTSSPFHRLPGRTDLFVSTRHALSRWPGSYFYC